jgi:hypothetical protein
MLSVTAAHIASLEAIVQAKPNNVEAIVERCAKGRWGERGYKECVVLGYQLHCLRTQIHELIFDLRTPMLVKQPFESTSSGPAGPDSG